MKKLIDSCLIAALLFMLSCNQHKTVNETVSAHLPLVSTVHPIIGDIQKEENLNGQVVCFNKTIITAPVTGYITDVKTALGNRVKKGDLLFKIQTKESQALQNSNASTLNEFGIIPVYANTSGFINTLNITESGVFINEGNIMANIVKNTDLVIQVNAPFEFSRLLKSKNSVDIELPDGEVLAASFYKALPKVDPISQTQQILFKLKEFASLPENLNVNVTFTSSNKKNSTLLPKDAVLTNETQDEFWIMKVTKDSLAIKVPIKKGLENNDKIEILKPKLSTSDEIIQKGAFGLPDSTKVKIY